MLCLQHIYAINRIWDRSKYIIVTQKQNFMKRIYGRVIILFYNAVCESGRLFTKTNRLHDLILIYDLREVNRITLILEGT